MHVKNGLRQINLKFHFHSSYDETINGLRIRSPKKGGGSTCYLYITNSNGSSKFRAIAENISQKTGNVTNKTDEIYSSGGSEQCVSTPFVGPAGFIRWNIQLFARLDSSISSLEAELKEARTFNKVYFCNSDSLKGLGFYYGKDDNDTRAKLTHNTTDSNGKTFKNVKFCHSTIAEKVKNGLRQINLKFHFNESYDRTCNGLRIRCPKMQIPQLIIFT
ncbi:Oidioi.mRNA.OKI2018_I69.chr2.g3949.t1.cds [Oikopleura dioica]|uniref:Oidioi.mRNA.OKI2018_I69.chr2.g3949.t1.cds n=1 Tax=Oikopleura dioica TaxID=34765 RepID=A0ABN7T1A3_OIKDI|nr:Oidioi.mRNA.OKI2018_I69.chr2.g3949.t1.cds [Oikopleura dioica]